MVTRSRWLLLAAWLAVATVAAHAADAPKPSETAPGKSAATATPAPAAAAKAPDENLLASQQRLANEYKELQGVLMRMRDLIRQTDPNRAALIEKALKESGDRHVEADFQEILDLLHQDQLGNAARKQDKINEDLQAILQLLLSEDRSKRLQDEKALIRKYLERLNNIIRDQQDLKGRNAGGDDPKSLSGEQGGLAKQTGNLFKDIGDNQEKYRGNGKDDSKNDGKNGGKPGGKDDSKNGEKGDGKSGGKGDGKSQPGDGKSSDKPGGKGEPDASASGQKPKDKDGAKGKPDDSASGQKPKDKDADDGKSQGKDKSSPSSGQGKGKGKGKQGQGQGQGQGQDQESDQAQQPGQDQNAPQQEQDPVRKRLQTAQEHMEQAKKRLEKAQKEGALDEQEKALNDLQTAKAELEEILRQLREEEMRRLLAMLEARMQKVLAIQREIYEGTVRLDKVPVAERSHGHEIESGRLSNREAEIVAEVEKALSLLREEGSAVAMPEALQQVRDDMQQIVYRLAQGKTEVLTQAIETDVIKALEEIIDALKKAQKDIDNKKKPPGPSPNGQPQDPPLIETLSELKMIRALQMRVNRRTERYAKLVQGEQADKDDVFDALQRLAEQQKRVQKVTRDLEMGKNE